MTTNLFTPLRATSIPPPRKRWHPHGSRSDPSLNFLFARVIYCTDMQANHGDNSSHHSSPEIQAQEVSTAGSYDDAAARELNESRTNALKLIDEGAFSCVTSCPLAPPLAHRAPSQLVSFKSMPGRGYWFLHGCVGFLCFTSFLPY